MANIYLIDLRNHDDIIIDLLSINETRKKYLEKLSEKSKKQSYIAWIFLKKIVLEEYRLDIDKLNLYYNEFNKPYFNEFEFNISHSGNYILIGISQNKIGVDIQQMNGSIDYKKMARKINCDSDDALKFYQRFSSLEAFYKKEGLGLKPSLLNNQVKVNYQNLIDNEYVVTVCVDNDEPVNLIKVKTI